MSHKLVYIAGASSDYARGSEWSSKLRARGIMVVSGWPESVIMLGCSNPSDISEEARSSIALSCVHQLNKATHLWMLLPTEPTYSVGAFWEYGYSYAKNLKLMASGGSLKSSVFTALGSLEYYKTDEEAFMAQLGKM